MKTRERERARDVGESETGEVDLRCAGRQAWRVREIGAVCHARASSFVRFGAHTAGVTPTPAGQCARARGEALISRAVCHVRAR